MSKTSLRYLIAMLALSALPTVGGEGRTPIWEPVAIVNPSGSYVVTRDIVAGTGSAIQLVGSGTEEVELDLNGFTVATTGAGAAGSIEATNLKKLVVRNGSIARSDNSGRALEIQGSVGGGGDSATDVTLEDLVLEGGATGMLLEDIASVAIRRCSVGNFTEYGILVINSNATSRTQAVTIVDNRVRNRTTNFLNRAGISVKDSDNVRIHGNRVHSASEGIDVGVSTGVSSVSIVDNEVVAAGFAGIFVLAGESCRIAGNTVSGSGSSRGIHLRDTSGCQVRNNSVKGVPQTGILLDVFQGSSNHNYVESNVVADNGGWGIHFETGSSGNTFSRNVAINNAGVGCAGVSSGAEFCDEPGTSTSLLDNSFAGVLY